MAQFESTFIIERIESSTRPGKFHEIRRGKDGKFYCTCEAWKFGKLPLHTGANAKKRIPRNCPHLDKFFAMLGDLYISLKVADLDKKVA